MRIRPRAAAAQHQADAHVSQPPGDPADIFIRYRRGLFHLNGRLAGLLAEERVRRFPDAQIMNARAINILGEAL